VARCIVTEFRLGINTGFATNRFVEADDWTGIVGRTLGLRIAQFTADLLYPWYGAAVVDGQVEAIRECARRHDVAIETTFTSAFTRVNHVMHPVPAIRQAWIEWFKTFCEISRRLGAEGVGSHFGIMTVRDCADAATRARRVAEGVEGWREIAEHAKGLGIEYLLFEPMSIPRENAHTIAATAELYEKVNGDIAIPMKLCLDVDHGDATSGDPRDVDYEAWLREFGAVSPVVHLKQSSADKSGHWPFTAEHNAKGVVRPEKVLRALEEGGAERVSLVLEFSFRERFPAEGRVIDDLRESVDYWREYVVG